MHYRCNVYTELADHNLRMYISPLSLISVHQQITRRLERSNRWYIGRRRRNCPRG